MEASRKHGPFDTRWSSARIVSSAAVRTARPLRVAEVAEALDWGAFAERYFHERKRHDAQARSAYSAYTRGREWRTTPARLRVVTVEEVSAVSELDRDEAGTRRLLDAIATDRSDRGGNHG